MPRAKIKAIAFDLGNVLVDFDHAIAARRIAPLSKMSAQEIFGLFFDSPLIGLFEEGKIAPEDFFERIKEMLGLKIDYPRFLPIWNEIFFITEKNRLTYALAAGLRNRFPLVMMSNINVLHIGYLRNKFDIFSVFNHLIFSCEVKVRKPDPRIFNEALRRLDSSAQELFYVDDRPDLVEGARNLGIEAFVFKGVEELKNDLISCGITSGKDHV